MVDGEKILPFVRAFYGQPSTYLWEDDAGEVHTVQQGEGGEQGDPLMPLFFCLGQHPALTAVSARLEAGEKLFAYLDDLYIVCSPGRLGAVHSLLEQHLRQRSGISVNAGKTKVWNRGAAFPPACPALQQAAALSCPTAIIWRGDLSLPTYQQGFNVLGVPLGHPDFVRKFLEGKIAEHRILLERIPEVPDTQSAWLLLSFCAAARANFFLRAVNLEYAEQFASSHDEGVWLCLCRILQISPSCHAQEVSSLPLWKGGLGLRSALRTLPAAHWASWADAVKMVKERHPEVADIILGALETGAESNSTQALLRCARILHDSGFESPSWAELAEGRTPGSDDEEEDPCQPRVGWQKLASSAIEKHHHDNTFWPQLTEPAQAMMRSQRGPMASVPFVSFPIDRTSRFDPAPFRTLLLRRFRLPLPLSVRKCRCGRPLDALGHHRAACATAGVLGRRGWALESVAARVCREGGGPESVRMFSCVTWTWQITTTWTAGASRWWQTGYLITAVPSWPLTLQWCHLSAPRRQSEARDRKDQRQSFGRSPSTQGKDVSRTCRRRWQGTFGCPRC